MSKWFPDVTESEGVKQALNSGVIGCLAFAAMNGLGIILLLATGNMPTTGDAVDQTSGAVIGILIELAFALFAAWRFRKAKGLISGTIILLIFVLEIFMKIASGTTNVGWMIAYAAIFVALVNGLRGAWASRNGSAYDSETFS